MGKTDPHEIGFLVTDDAIEFDFAARLMGLIDHQIDVARWRSRNNVCKPSFHEMIGGKCLEKYGVSFAHEDGGLPYRSVSVFASTSRGQDSIRALNRVFTAQGRLWERTEALIGLFFVWTLIRRAARRDGISVKGGTHGNLRHAGQSRGPRSAGSLEYSTGADAYLVELHQPIIEGRASRGMKVGSSQATALQDVEQRYARSSDATLDRAECPSQQQRSFLVRKTADPDKDERLTLRIRQAVHRASRLAKIDSRHLLARR